MFHMKVPTRSPGTIPSRCRAAASSSRAVGHLGEGRRAGVPSGLKVTIWLLRFTVRPCR